MRMRTWTSLPAAAMLAVGMLAAGGCLDSQVSTVTTAKEFNGEMSLDTIRKSIIGWQTMNMDQPLPDSLKDISNVPAEFRNAPDGLVDGYVIRFLKADDNAHYILVAYPKDHGFHGQRTYFLAETGSVKSKDFGKDHDHSDWEYDSALAEVQ